MGPKAKYRPNIAIIALNHQKKILAGRRHAHHQTWQLPQGGIEEGETPEQALQRELQEETGISQFKLLGRTKKWIYYRWPKEFSDENRKYIGQKQLYFVVSVGKVDLASIAPTEEFVEFNWFTAQEVLDNVIQFKRDSYSKAFAELNLFF